MNIVSKQDYWTTILNDLSQFGQISTEDPKFNEIADYVWRVLQNTLILTEDEKQIKHWEEIVNVSGEGLTQFQRKVNLLFLLSEKSYIPMNLLRKALDRLLGDGKYDLVVDDENDTVTLYYDGIGLKEKSKFILSKTVPSYYNYNVWDNSLPANYFYADFLESTGTQRIVLPEIASNVTGAEVKFFKEDYSHAPLGVNRAGYRWFIPYFRTDKIAHWGWINNYDYNKLKTKNISEVKFNWRNDKRVIVNDEEVSLLNDVDFTAAKLHAFCYVWGNVPDLYEYGSCRIYYMNISQKENIVEKLIPAIDEKGRACMFDCKSNTQFYNTGTGTFVVGLTRSQAIQLKNLPIMDGTLTVSLPYEAQLVQHKPEIDEALLIAKDRGWTITVQYRDEWSDDDVRDKYESCTNKTDLANINSDYKNDLTIDGRWIYPLPNMTNANNILPEKSYLTAIYLNLPVCTQASYAFAHCGNLHTFSGSLPLLRNGYEMFKASGGFKHFHSSVPSLSAGVRMFDYCKLDKESALNVLQSIPSYSADSHPLTMGIHIDYQSDEEVLTAISNAEAKGWTMTVQWNGTPTATTASTYGLRKPTIYAKLGETVDINGEMKPSLDWGHYVTNSEENGYQEFSSVEEANEYFNIESETE